MNLYQPSPYISPPQTQPNHATDCTRFFSFQRSEAENQHFQWSHTSEDSYAEANETNASGYEADSVLASMMQETMDDYHNQEPIVDVQEPQSWSLCRRYRGAMQGPDVGDYSDDDGGGTFAGGGARKMMRMSFRPEAPSDEFSTFSDYVAERMRNLRADKALQLMARRDIEQVLFKYEMKLLEQKRDSQQHEQPDTEAATTSKSISQSPVSDIEQQ